MENWVRVQNDRDRRVLAWLRGQVGDAEIALAAQACARGDSKPHLSMVCRQLGLRVPRLPTADTSSAIGERYLAAMYEILRNRVCNAHVET